MDEQLLRGGNTHAAVVRVGNTVRRPTGAWTPGVHAVLRHLEDEGFEGAPRVLGIDSQGREILTFIPGDVVYPDHFDRLMTDEGLMAVARLIRDFHSSISSFDADRGYVWSDRGTGRHPHPELVCHNDLAPWNLVHTPDNRWVFIDWDLAAPGPRSWDIAWALLTFIPLMPSEATDVSRIEHRLRLFKESYGTRTIGPELIDVAVARCTREADLIATLGAKNEPPYDRLLAEGHLEIWSEAAQHVESWADRWKNALLQPASG